MNELPAALPWYRSPVFVSALVSVVTQLVVVFGLADTITAADIAKYVDLALQIVALAAAGYAMWKRKTSVVQPLTMTQKRADDHPVTAVVVPVAAPNAAEPAPVIIEADIHKPE